MTYSIVARCPTTGQMGVAVQTHFFAVGTVVPWARAGVGAVATQSWADPSYGPEGLALLEKGALPLDALTQLVHEDPRADVRQVALIDSQGVTAVHTGSGCVAHAGHRQLDGATVQANMMLNDGVPDAMAESWNTTAADPFAQRLLTALVAAQRAGGDIRGQQSAAMLIVDAERRSKSWEGTLVNLRVDDHRSPLDELARLMTINSAYSEAYLADELMVQGDSAGAAHAYERALQHSPGSPEFSFWYAVLCAHDGDMAKARALFQQASAHSPEWRELLARLPDSTVIDTDRSVIEELLEP